MAISLKDFKQEDYLVINGMHISKTLWERPDVPIYRYMDVEYLLSLLNSKKLHINNRQKFEDLNELGWRLGIKGSFPPIPQIKNKQKQKELNVEYHSKWISAYSCCISCWTKGIGNNTSLYSENYLMWKNYTSKYGIRIATTYNDLVNSINCNSNEDIILDNVMYSENERKSFLVKDMIFTKRAFYKDEREVRLCVLDNNSFYLLEINPKILIKEITFSPFMPIEIRKIFQTHLEKNYEWLKGKIHSSQICTKNNLV